jgi:hypothetical protein
MEFIQAATTIRAISYTDAFSAEHSAYNDLVLGHQYGKVGCNSKVFGSDKTQPGDLVLIMAPHNNRRFFTMGVLEERLQTCTLWKDNGGEEWEFNFSYMPLLGIHEVTEPLLIRVHEIAEEHGLKATNFFHSRFCSVKLKPIFLKVFQYLDHAAVS